MKLQVQIEEGQLRIEDLEKQLANTSANAVKTGVGAAAATVESEAVKRLKFDN